MLWVLGLFIAWLLGCFIARQLLWPLRSYALTTGIGWCIAMILISVSFWLWRITPLASQLSYQYLYFLIFTIPLCVLAYKEYINQSISIESEYPSIFRQHPYLTSLLCLSIIISLISIILLLQIKPHGEWDAWAIWNLKAKMLSSDLNWPDTFSQRIGWSHTDYPLLLPSVISALWSIDHSHEHIYDQFIPAAVATGFAFHCVALLFGFIDQIKHNMLSLIATSILLSTVFFIRQTAGQLADIPLATLLLATTGCLMLMKSQPQSQCHRSNAAMYFLVGLLAGSLAWTKNEGIMMLLIITFALLIHLHKQNKKQYTLHFILGLLAPIVCLVWLKAGFSSHNDLFNSDSQISVYIEKVLDPTRHITILQHYLQSLWDLQRIWLILIPVYLIRYRYRNDERPNPAIKTILTILLCICIGEYVIYLITPQDLSWHLETSLQRLLLQLWPAFLLWFGLYAKPMVSTDQRPDA